MVSQDSIGTIAEAQHAYCWHLPEAHADALLASLHAVRKDGKCAGTLLFRCTCHPATAWLDTIPLSRALQLNREFQTALRRLAILPLNGPTVQCGCRATLVALKVEYKAD